MPTNVDAKARSKERASIAAFYVGRNIFVTGGTGFLGKVLIEKTAEILSRCWRDIHIDATKSRTVDRR